MKAVTHYLFSIGVSLGLLSLTDQLTLWSTATALWLSVAINYLIDVVGHVSRDGRPTRTRFTHSVLTAPLWGLLVSIASLGAVTHLSNPASSSGEDGFWALMGVLVSGEHLFLDSLTQAGIYTWRGRIAIAHYRYDNAALNIGFALLGALLILFALGP
jgi:hypothetical protein